LLSDSEKEEDDNEKREDPGDNWEEGGGGSGAEKSSGPWNKTAPVQAPPAPVIGNFLCPFLKDVQLFYMLLATKCHPCRECGSFPLMGEGVCLFKDFGILNRKNLEVKRHTFDKILCFVVLGN
jgi:hypothetical protein